MCRACASATRPGTLDGTGPFRWPAQRPDPLAAGAKTGTLPPLAPPSPGFADGRNPPDRMVEDAVASQPPRTLQQDFAEPTKPRASRPMRNPCRTRTSPGLARTQRPADDLFAPGRRDEHTRRRLEPFGKATCGRPGRDGTGARRPFERKPSWSGGGQSLPGAQRSADDRVPPSATAGGWACAWLGRQAPRPRDPSQALAMPTLPKPSPAKAHRLLGAAQPGPDAPLPHIKARR